MTDRELMQMALDALEAMQSYAAAERKGLKICDEAIETLRAALAQQENQRARDSLPLMVEALEKLEQRQKALAQPEQEPVACDCDSPAWCKQYKKCNRVMLGIEPYVAPPQREWQGLTDEDLSVCDEDGVILARYWEAKLKERNT